MTKRSGSIPRIAFDSWVLGGHIRHQGVHVYANNLLAHFREIATNYSVEIMPYVSKEMDNDANQFEAAPGFIPKQTKLLKQSRLWRYGGACTLASFQRPDLVFNPHCATLYMGNLAPAVTTIHDLIPVLMPFPSRRITQILRTFLWSAAHLSRAIITVSEHSKTDLMKIYKIPESKISVIYNGYDATRFNDTQPDAEMSKSLRSRLGINKPYLLHYGAIRPNKNLKRLIEAYRLLIERERELNVDLLLTGIVSPDHREIVAAAQEHTGKRGRIVFTGTVGDSELPTLIKGAVAVVIPSLYEGFCLPMVESMACGVPTIVSTSSCLPEISGGVLKYFDPFSIEEISSCMRDVISSKRLRHELSRNGTLRATHFDWRRCAKETLEILIAAC